MGVKARIGKAGEACARHCREPKTAQRQAGRRLLGGGLRLACVGFDVQGAGGEGDSRAVGLDDGGDFQAAGPW